MSQLESYEVRVEDFLAALTDATLHDEADLWELAVRYDVPAAEAQRLAQMVNRLESTFVDVSPSSQFRGSLRQQLVGTPAPQGMFGRVRNLPPRLQIAAAVALLAAMALLGRRRMTQEAGELLQQVRGASSSQAKDTDAIEAAAR
jgi:hypothetical protein